MFWSAGSILEMIFHFTWTQTLSLCGIKSSTELDKIGFILQLEMLENAKSQATSQTWEAIGVGPKKLCFN